MGHKREIHPWLDEMAKQSKVCKDRLDVEENMLFDGTDRAYLRMLWFVSLFLLEVVACFDPYYVFRLVLYFV